MCRLGLNDPLELMSRKEHRWLRVFGKGVLAGQATSDNNNAEKSRSRGTLCIWFCLCGWVCLNGYGEHTLLTCLFVQLMPLKRHTGSSCLCVCVCLLWVNSNSKEPDSVMNHDAWTHPHFVHFYATFYPQVPLLVNHFYFLILDYLWVTMTTHFYYHHYLVTATFFYSSTYNSTCPDCQ